MSTTQAITKGPGEILLSARSLTKRFGGLAANQDVSLDL